MLLNFLIISIAENDSRKSLEISEIVVGEKDKMVKRFVSLIKESF